MAKLLKSPALGRASLVILLLLVIEWIAARRLVNPLALARPSASALQLWDELLTGELIQSLLVTFYEIFLAFVIAGLIGLSIGYFLWRFETIGKAGESFLGAIAGTPHVLLYPVILVFFGRTTTVPLVMGVMVGVIPVIINTKAGLSAVRGPLIKLGRSLNCTNFQIFMKLLLPAAAPTIFSGLKMGLVYVMIGVTAMEYLTEIGGLGKMISSSFVTFATATLYGYIAVVVLVAVLLVEMVNRLEGRIR